MELKQRANTSDNRAIVRLNCTVMELKPLNRSLSECASES